MKLGPELDKLIAYKVMGWQPDFISCDKECWQWSDTFWTNGYIDEPYTPFEPSTSIASAWEVVEKINLEKVGINIWFRGDGYRCEIRGLEKHEFIVGAFAETAPHAICLAALKSVGVDIGK